MKRILCVFISILIILNYKPLFASSQIPAYLCELGIKFYQEGRYNDALTEFKKALVVKPGYEPALRYIQMIEGAGSESYDSSLIPSQYKPESSDSSEAAAEIMDLIKLQKEMIGQRKIISEGGAISPLPASGQAHFEQPAILNLDASFKNINQPIQIEQGKTILIFGNNIQRYLATNPDVLNINRKDPDNLEVTGREVGYSYLHIWDNDGRWTAEFLNVYPQPDIESYDELMRKEREKARNFKFLYTMDWSSFYLGRRIHDIERTNYSWTRNLILTGQTPYGNFDAKTVIRTVDSTTDLTYFTMGLSDGIFGQFKGFDLRGFDYSPNFANLILPGATLRGFMMSSPAFNNKLDYTVFWGQEGGGRYGNLSPSLEESKDSYLNGINLSFSPTTKQNYKFTFSQGYGDDRDNYLNNHGYDASGNWRMGAFDFNYEVANDSQAFAHVFRTNYAVPKFNLEFEFRDINEEFMNMTGYGWRQGEFGYNMGFTYLPNDKLRISNILNVYRDRLYPAEDKPDRWNEDDILSIIYQVDPLTSINANYTIENELGRLSQYRYQNAGAGISKTFQVLSKDIGTYLNYNHQESKNYQAHSLDYVDDRLIAGLRFSLIGDLYYYVSKEVNYLDAKETGIITHPNALETGVDWSGQFGQTPLYGSFRFTYRDEEDTISPLSFLSGEDYIEGYTELSYKPTDDVEVYASCRGRNVWADNPNVTKRFEMDFRAGLRYLWDTGFYWDAIGNVEGYVFRDINGDGLRQRDDPPMQGVKLWLGKDKSAVTDEFGYFKFVGIKAAKAYVTLEASSLPAGFVLTVPASQEATIIHHRTCRVNFGVISRSEITGYIFDDSNGNSIFNPNEKGIKGVVVSLEDGKKAITDGSGKYIFPNVSTGKHTISVDINTIPIDYLPKTAVQKEIDLFEGITYIYNVPLKKIEDQQ